MTVSSKSLQALLVILPELGSVSVCLTNDEVQRQRWLMRLVLALILIYLSVC